MKNIIKRGTSLLLVVAMLLSFAAVVGAEPATTEGGVSGQFVKIWAEPVALKAGERAQVPIYVEVDSSYGLGLVNFNVYSDPGITIANIVKADGVSGDLVSGDYVTASGRTEKIAVWTSNKPLGWIEDQWNHTLQKPTTNKHLLAYALVMADNNVTAGGYALHFAPFQNGKDNGKTDVVVEVIAADNEADKGAYKKDSTEIIDGAAIVYDTLPMVALTKTTFDVPTMEGITTGTDEARGDYDLRKYVKLVTKEGQLQAVTDLSVELQAVDGASLVPVSLKDSGQTLSLGVKAEKNAKYKLVVSSANGVQFTTAAELPFTVSKQDSAFTMAGFTKNGGYAKPTDFAPSYNGPVYTAGSTTYSYVSLEPKAFDQYGQPMGGQYTATTEFKLYSDAQYEDEITDTNIINSITVETNGSLKISSDLKTDVWCKVRPVVTVGTETKHGYGDDGVKFQIVSKYPHATRAEIVLKDVGGNQYMDSQGKPLYIFTIPAPGQNPVQIKIDATVYDQKNGVMDGVTYTVKAYWGTKDSGGTEIKAPGEVEKASATLENGVLTITSEALSLLNPTTGAGATITVTVSVTGTNVTATKTITLTKAQSVATSLASNNSGWNKGQIVLNPMNVAVPGIGLTNDSATNAAVVQVLDQYDQPMKNADGSYIMVPVENFAFYPARVATAEDTDTTDDTAGGKYVKTGKAIPSEYAWFTFNSSNSGMLLHLKNDKVGNSLILDTGAYIVEAMYTTAEGTTLKAGGVLKPERSTSVPTTATVEADSSIAVPYADRTEPYNSTVLRATVTDQYGDEITSGITMELDPSVTNFSVYEPNATTPIKTFTKENNAVQVTENMTASTLTVKVSKDLAEYMVKRNGTVVTNGELRLPVKVTVGEGEHAPTLDATAKVNVSREASVLKKATVRIKDAKGAAVKTVTLTDESSSTQQQTINMTSPKVDTNYYFDVKYFDQYGGEMTSTFGTAFYPETTGLSWQGGTTNMLTAKAGAEGTFSLTVPGGNTRFQFNVKFAPIQFVNGKGEPYTIGKLLDTAKLSKVYNRDTWYQVIEGASAVTGPNDENSKVYIRGAEGQNNVEVTQKIWAEVIDKTTGQTVYDARDSLANPAGPTASATEKAGTYIVKIFYREKEGDAPIEVCSSGEFTISPKPITIGLKANATIEKEYDGTTKLPGDAANKLELTGKVGNDDVDIETGNLVFESKDVNASVDSETNLVIGDVNIVAVTGASLLLGADAGNYTASIAGLKGKITQKALDVYVEYYNKEWNGTKIIGGDAGRLADQSQVAKDDVVSVSSTRTTGLEFASSDAGSKLPATLPEGASITVTLEGASAGNYKVGTIRYNGGDTGATITKAKFTLDSKNVPKSYVYGDDATALAINPSHLKLEGGTSVGTSVIDYINSKTAKPSLFPNSATTSASRHYNAGRNYPVSVSIPTDDQGNYEIVLTPTGLTITIEQCVLTVAPKNMPIEKTYDGKTTLPENAVFDVAGSVSGEELNFDRAKLHFESADAGQRNIVADEGFLKSVTNGGVANYKVTMGGQMFGTIKQKNIEDESIKIEQVNIPTYDGTEKMLEFAVKDGTTPLTNLDYTISSNTYTDASKNHTVTFYGQGNYWGQTAINYGKINKHCGTIFLQEDLGFEIGSAKRGQEKEFTVSTDVVLKSTELVQADGTTRNDVITWALDQNKDFVDEITVTPVENQKQIKIKVKLKNTAVPEEKIRLRVVADFDDAVQNFGSGFANTLIIKVTEKDTQTLTVATADGRSSYSYSEAGVRMNVSGNKTNVTWSIDTSNPRYQEYAEIVDGSYVKFKKPGTVVIKASAEETDTYTAAEQTYVLTITKGDITVTASSATMTANDPLPGFSATASGLNPKDSVSEVFQTLTATVSTDGKTAGTFRVTPNAVFKTGVKDWNEYYELSFVQGTLTVNPAVSVIDTVLPTIIAGNGCANGYANCACESFYDLDASRWYHESVDWAYNLGLMNGTTKSTFGPNAAATRAQTWTMLARIAGQDTRRSSTWYEVGQKWAMGLGITDGTNPMGSLTREQLAAMLYRYVGSPALNGTLTFTDSANVSAWARNAMIWAVQNGILDGVGGNRLNPKGTTTRAQAAAIFMRFSKLINK